MDAPPIIRPLESADADALWALRHAALVAEPLAFSSSPGDDRFRGIDAVRAALVPGEERAIFGAFDGASLGGMVGVMREARRKLRHRAGIWGMYVAPEMRGRGAGRLLLNAAVERARSWTGVILVELGVADTAASAQRLYESAGFRVWGRQPRAVLSEGRFVDHLHLVLDLDAPQRPGRD